MRGKRRQAACEMPGECGLFMICCPSKKYFAAFLLAQACCIDSDCWFYSALSSCAHRHYIFSPHFIIRWQSVSPFHANETNNIKKHNHKQSHKCASLSLLSKTLNVRRCSWDARWVHCVHETNAFVTLIDSFLLKLTTATLKTSHRFTEEQNKQKKNEPTN